jgi:hypothetical protein
MARVGGAFISIEYAHHTSDSRQAYRYHIDLPGGKEYSSSDLASGVGGGSLQSGLESLLSFLSACGEGRSYSTRTGSESENADLFPEYVAEFTEQYSDELSMLAIELEENQNAIQE